MINRWLEFFEGEDKLLSIKALVYFLCFGVSTIELLRLNTETALGYYLSAFVSGYVGGKGVEIWKNNRKKDDC